MFLLLHKQLNYGVKMQELETFDYIFEKIVEAKPENMSFQSGPGCGPTIPNGMRTLKIDDDSYRVEFYAYECGRYFKEAGTGEDTYFFASDAIWGAKPLLFHTYTKEGFMARYGQRLMTLDFSEAGQEVVYRDQFRETNFTLEGRRTKDFWNDLDI